MPWLIAFLVAHAIEISAIGAGLAAVASAEEVVVNTVTIVKDAKKE